MRVYLPLTLAGLQALERDGELRPAEGESTVAGHAVTGAIREWYTEGDLEELEYSAMVEAAEACLDLLAADARAPRLRVVVAAEVPDADVVAGGRFRSSVSVTAPLPLAVVASLHVDEAVAEPVVAAAVEALPAAHRGDDDARFLLDEAEAADLLWFDVSEIGDVASVVSPRS